MQSFIKYLALTFILITVSCTTVQKNNFPDEQPPDGNSWITVAGKASKKEFAIGKAWRNAMVNYVQDNIPRIYNFKRNKIENYIAKNWRRYTVGEPIIVENYYKRRIVVRVKIKEDKLLHDIRRL